MDKSKAKRQKPKSQKKDKVRKLILTNGQPPGDVVMMTCAIRDLHNTHPGKFITDVRVAGENNCIFEGNSYITPLKDDEGEKIKLGYPIIHQSNQGSYHFVHGFRKDLESKIGVSINQGFMKGDIYIRDEEKGWISVVEEITNDKRDFWIIDAGYKKDFTAKAWWPDNFQKVVDHFKNKIQFVQIGHEDHTHPKLKGVINLIGRTDLRQLIRLIYHSVGIITPISLPMTLAAAIPMKLTPPKNRPCVVLSGGREPVQWQAYPFHQFIHTMAALDCCDDGGCWRSRVVKLKDKEVHNSSTCFHPIKRNGNAVGKCMDMIKPKHVIESVKMYYNGGLLKYLKKGQETYHVDYKGRKANVKTEACCGS